MLCQRFARSRRALKISSDRVVLGLSTPDAVAPLNGRRGTTPRDPHPSEDSDVAVAEAQHMLAAQDPGDEAPVKQPVGWDPQNRR